MNINELKRFEDKTVVVQLADGEVSSVKVDFVDFEYKDIIVTILQTNRPEQYKDMASSAYVIRAADLVSVHEIGPNIAV